VCFDFLHNSGLKHYSFYKKFSEMIKNVYWSSWIVPEFLSDFNETWLFSTLKNPQISSFINISSVVTELFREDVWTNLQTDMMKLTVAFHNFVTAHKNQETAVTWKCVKQFSHSTNLIAITTRQCDCYYFIPDRQCIHHPPKCLHPAS